MSYEDDDSDEEWTNDQGDWLSSAASLLLTAVACIVVALATAYMLRIAIEAIL